MNADPTLDKPLDRIGDATGCLFLAQLRIRVSRGETMSTIGRELGVRKQSVHQWLTGATTPSRTVLLLASYLYRAPIDLSAGLPGDGRRVGS